MAGAGDRWIDSPCIACGGCVDACPTGALFEIGFRDPRPIETITRTTCGYCGVGCSLDVHVRDDAVAAVTPALDGPVNRGHACVKGRFAHAFARSPDRLTSPLIRRDGRLQPATWEASSISAGTPAIRGDRPPVGALQRRHHDATYGQPCAAAR